MNTSEHTPQTIATDAEGATKPIHEKMPKDSFEPGKEYAVSLDGRALYSAEVTKHSGGCWATVKVVKPLDETLAAEYPAGATFDIKVAGYEFE